MQTNLRQAFTVVELIFVIVVIGILAAVALPRFGESADNAYLAKAQSEVATIRAALATERQKRVLRSDFTDITDLALKDDGTASAGNAFDHFSADGDGNNAAVFQYPIPECSSATARACWDRVNATHYEFRFLNASDGVDGKAKFILQNNRFDCDGDDADCQRITL
ncbi:MAG: type II secretion system protein [Sulfurimonas sp.]